MMTSATDRPLRSFYPVAIRRWCAVYARRWRIPVDDLVSVVFGGDIIPFPDYVQGRAGGIRNIAVLLDTFISADLQWNFWFRSNVCIPISPMCRLRWSDCLDELQDELLTLRDAHSHVLHAGADPSSVLKLFQPRIMFKKLEHGWVVTHISDLPLSSGPPPAALIPSA